MVPPVTLPGLPDTPGVPGVAAGAPLELAPGVVALPGWVVDVPGCVVVGMPGWVCAGGCVCAGVPVCVPIPGLGVTVPVFCPAAMLTARANTDDANKILRIKTCSL
jgi:hypothetical protein